MFFYFLCFRFVCCFSFACTSCRTLFSLTSRRMLSFSLVSLTWSPDPLQLFGFMQSSASKHTCGLLQLLSICWVSTTWHGHAPALFKNACSDSEVFSVIGWISEIIFRIEESKLLIAVDSSYVTSREGSSGDEECSHEINIGPLPKHHAWGFIREHYLMFWCTPHNWTLCSFPVLLYLLSVENLRDVFSSVWLVQNTPGLFRLLKDC